jgi:predicted permease
MTDQQAAGPPRLAAWLLRRSLPRDEQAACIAGDLLEEFRADVARRSRAYAARRYWRHALSVAARYAFAARKSRGSSTYSDQMRTSRMLLDVLRQDLRYAWRSLVKSPGFAMVVVLTLAVGIGANTAIFSVLHAVVLRDLPYRDADRLALLWTMNLRQNLRDGSSYLNFRDWKEMSHAFEDMAVYRRPNLTRATLTGVREPERIHVALVGPGFFRVLGAPPFLGRTLDAADVDGGHRAIVISHSLWRQRFAGDPGVIGRSIQIDGDGAQVIGVMDADFTFPSADVQVWSPISVLPMWQRIQHDPASRGGDPLLVIGRLHPSATMDSARAELTAIAAHLRAAYPASNGGLGIAIEPLVDHVLGARTGESLWMLLGAVGLVLLISCANVANLALARGAARRHEVSLRIALGASRLRLVRQALTENLVLASMAAGAGLLFAWFGVAVLRQWASAALPRLDRVSLDPAVVLFALAVSLCGVFAGLLPALKLPAANPMGAIAEAGPRKSRSIGTRRLRHGLVIAELALAVILLSAAGLLIRSFVRVQGIDRGFDSAHVLLLQVDLPVSYDGQARKAEFFRYAFDRIRALPGVSAAGAIDDLFIQRQPDLRITPEGQPAPRSGEPAPPLIRDRVIPGYFEAMRIPLLQGRLLQDSDLVDNLDVNQPEAVVINEAMARRFWPGENPVGKRFKYGVNPAPTAAWTTVVGVVADMRRQKLEEAPVPCIFWPGYGGQMDIVVRTLGDPATLRQAIRAELIALDPAVPPYGIVGAEQRLSETVALRTLQTLLLAALAASALLLAVIGVYSVIHQSVISRTQEIGVRMALGATNTSVLRMVLSSALGLAAIGLTLGLLGALAVGRSISAFLYETSPVDTITFAAVPMLLIVVTVVACLTPARRAARIDPMVALRVE